MRQAEAFLFGEGDNWYERNKRAELNYNVVNAILELDIQPDRILEVGCGNGRYLAEYQRYFAGRGCTYHGIDPSQKAIADGRANYQGIKFWVNTALKGLQQLHEYRLKYDLIIFGFCLYVVDREDLFDIVAMADRLLADGGHIAIHDFAPSVVYKVPYHHKQGLFTYKMDYARLWLGNPGYKEIARQTPAPAESMVIIKKVGWE